MLDVGICQTHEKWCRGDSSAALEALVKPTDNRKNELYFFYIFCCPLCSAFDSQKTGAQKTKLPVKFRFLRLLLLPLLCMCAPLFWGFFLLVRFKISPAHLIIAAKQNYIAQVESRSRSAEREKSSMCVEGPCGGWLYEGLDLSVQIFPGDRSSVFGLHGLCPLLQLQSTTITGRADLRQSLWQTKACERVKERGSWDTGRPQGGCLALETNVYHSSN